MIGINNKPSQLELDTFLEVLEWIIDWHKKNEPFATVVINAAEEVRSQIPYEVEEFVVE